MSAPKDEMKCLTTSASVSGGALMTVANSIKAVSFKDEKVPTALPNQRGFSEIGCHFKV